MEEQMRDLREVVERMASSLRDELSEAFKLGDDHLKSHIDQSYAQVQLALEAADKQVVLALTAAEQLEAERVENVEVRMREHIDHLSARVNNGDAQLRDHVIAQVGQISAALEALRRETALAHAAAGELEKTRIDELRAMLEQRVARVQNELLLVHEASEKAIQKAEMAAERRFESVNEFRAQLTDQTANFLPREVAEAQFSELRKRLEEQLGAVGSRLERATFEATVQEWTAWRDTVNTAIIQSASGQSERRRTEDRTQPWAIWAGGAVLTIVITLVVVIVNVVTTSP